MTLDEGRTLDSGLRLDSAPVTTTRKGRKPRR